MLKNISILKKYTDFLKYIPVLDTKNINFEEIYTCFANTNFNFEEIHDFLYLFQITKTFEETH